MISSSIRKAGPYAGDGSTTVFPFAFKVFTTADVQVVYTDTLGVETVLATGYSVSLNSNQETSPGGTVTLTGALAVGARLTLTSALSPLQPMQITNGGGFFPRVLNDSADRAMILIQQLYERVGRTLAAPISSDEPLNGLLLPSALARAGKLLAFDANGSLVPVSSSIGPGDGGLRTDLANALLGPTLMGYRRSAAATPTTVLDRLKREVWAEDYGFATANTGAQNLAAIDLAIADLPATGGVIRIGLGTFTCNPIKLPVDPKTVDIQGSGFGTILVMGTPDGPLISRNGTVFGDGRITGGNYGGFTIRAHAASDYTNLTHRAISFTGFCKSNWHDIRYVSDAAGGAVGCVFEADAWFGPTYSNVIERIEVAGLNNSGNGRGPSRILYLHNAGNGSLGNPNLTEFRDSWIYANVGIALACDVYNSTRTKVDNVIFEDNGSMSCVGLGQNTVVSGCWFELIGNAILTSSAASVDGSNSIVMGNYFSGPVTSYIDPIGAKPLWIGNAGGGAINSQIGGAGVTRLSGGSADPAAPTLALTGGGTTSSGPTLVSAAVAIAKDAVGRTTYALHHTVTPSGVNFIEFQFTLPAGYVLENYTVGATRGTNGKPVLVAMQPDNSKFIMYFEGADNHEIVTRITIREQ